MGSTRKKITVNATSAIVQVAFTALLYFFLYKYLLDRLGASQLGVWSLILSFSSIANLANLGLTSGLVKFVADYLAEKTEDKIGKLILTSFISLTVLFAVFSIIILVCARYLLPYVIDSGYISLALSILPLSLASFCINSISGVFTSVLEGFQKNYLRNFIYIFTGVIMFVATVLLTPHYNLKGVAIAQLIQSAFVLISALLIIIKISPYNGFRFWKWSNNSFRELFDYGYKFQIVSICQLLYEPTTKMLLSKFGGLTLLGHYEMASRMVNQFRSLLVSANQVVIPVVAETVKTKSKEYMNGFYASMNRVMVLFAFPLATILLILTPFISIIWVGYYEQEFVISSYILIMGYTVNIMSSPAFFSCMGEGHLNIPVASHTSMAIINLLLGWLLGVLLGGYGAILGWGLALILGSALTVFLYDKRINTCLRHLLTGNEWSIIISSALLIVCSLMIFSLNTPHISYTVRTVMLVMLYIITSYIVLHKNVYIKEVLGFLGRRTKNNNMESEEDTLNKK